jgi:hypothetical protein
MQVYALLSRQGTACHETFLTGNEYSHPIVRARVEAAARAYDGPREDAPVLGSWTLIEQEGAA